MNTVLQQLGKLLGQQDSPLWGGYVNMLKHMESVFVSPKHWILEFLQNAEDAKAGEFSIQIDNDSLFVLNNGIAFNEDDFCALCDVNSRKLPSLGFRGYIGIGFKSIFRLADQVDIHSADYHFKFDKEHWQQQDISLSRWPWEILPIEIQPVKLPENYTTGFFVPCVSEKSQELLYRIQTFLESTDFPKEAILLLKNVQEINVRTPRMAFSILKETEESGTLHIREGEITQEIVKVRTDEGQQEIESAYYLVFRKVVQVPSEIKGDEETERVRRSDVSEREVGLVFGLDSGKNLRIMPGKLTGVYSFLPVEGEQTGLPFGLFGDFIPQLGRDLVNYGANWNVWMREEVLNFLKEMVEEVFLPHGQWLFFIAELLEFLRSSTLQGPSESFWGVGLKSQITAFLESGAFYPDCEEDLRRLDELVTVDAEVVKVVGRDTLENVLQGKKIAHPSIKPQLDAMVDNVGGVYDLLSRKEMLESLIDDTQKLADCYGLIEHLTDRQLGAGRGRAKPLKFVPFVLTKDRELFPPTQVIMPLIELDDFPRFLLTAIPRAPKVLHPDIQRNQKALEQLKRCELVIIDMGEIIENVRSLVNNTKSRESCPESWRYPDDLIEAALFLISNGELMIDRLVADDETLHAPQNLFVPGAPLDWTPIWEDGLLPGVQPVHECYLIGESSERTTQCLGDMGAHGFRRKSDKSLIEKSAYRFAKKKLAEKGHRVADVTERRRLGYDFQCQGHCDKVFEVKGMADPHDIELEESECNAALQRKDDYVLVCVYNLPAQLGEVKYREILNPESIWRPVEKARVPRDVWLRI